MAKHPNHTPQTPMLIPGRVEDFVVKNVLAAGGADITVKGRDIHVVNPRILPAGSDGSGLPLPMRATLKVAAVLVADIAA
jgi:hypothetical protein